MDQFEQFWAAWPKSFRKGGKAKCAARWKKGLYDHCADQIIKHIAWMKTTTDWRKDNGLFIPAPIVYLNQQRWDGADIPENFGFQEKYTIDPALAKIEADRKKATPMPEEIRKKLAELRKPIDLFQ
jgi:hypothetical protein